MSVTVREYSISDIPVLREIWNAIVDEGSSFPQEDFLDEQQATAFFAEQTHVGVAQKNGETVGFYILHPNNVGRCGHIGNSSYAVKSGHRGEGIGEKLIRDSLCIAAKNFKILQFNAVVASNDSALYLYKKLGFTTLGTIPGGFKTKNGTYEDIVLFYITLA